MLEIFWGLRVYHDTVRESVRQRAGTLLNGQRTHGMACQCNWDGLVWLENQTGMMSSCLQLGKIGRFKRRSTRGITHKTYGAYNGDDW